MSRESIDLSISHGIWEGEEIMHPGLGVPERILAHGRAEITPILGGLGTSSDYVHRRDGQVALHGHIVTIPSSRDEEDVSMHWMSAVSKTIVFRGRLRAGVLTLKAEAEGRIHRLEQDFSEADVMRTRSYVGTDPGDLPLVFEGTYHRQQASKLGTFAWLDLTVDDASTLRDFYAGVVGWKAQSVSMGDYDDFSMVAENGQVVAGVCHARGGNAEVPPVWMNYVYVADLETSLARVRDHGGRIVVPPRQHGDDRYAMVADPAGAVVGLYQRGVDGDR